MDKKHHQNMALNANVWHAEAQDREQRVGAIIANNVNLSNKILSYRRETALQGAL